MAEVLSKMKLFTIKDKYKQNSISDWFNLTDNFGVIQLRLLHRYTSNSTSPTIFIPKSTTPTALTNTTTTTAQILTT